MFAFRVIVDIALKALSPAINDPTTAVLALDQVQRLLRLVGQRKLRGEVILDDGGQPRAHLPHSELGRLRPGRLQRDSCMRCQQPADRSPHARNARESSEHTAGAAARGAGRGTRACWIGRSRHTSAGPRNSRWPAFPIRKDWAGRQAGISRTAVDRYFFTSSGLTSFTGPTSTLPSHESSERVTAWVTDSCTMLERRLAMYSWNLVLVRSSGSL